MRLIIGTVLDFLMVFLLILIFDFFKDGKTMLIFEDGSSSIQDISPIKDLVILGLQVLFILIYYIIIVKIYKRTIGYKIAGLSVHNWSNDTTKFWKEITLRSFIPIFLSIVLLFEGFYKEWVWWLIWIYVITDYYFYTSNNGKSIGDLLSGTVLESTNKP